MKLSAHATEIALIVLLLVIVALTRVYYGDSSGLMVVWKGEFTLADTFVNVKEMANLPRSELEAQHRDVFYQMEDMGLIEQKKTGQH